ncbi:15338_t:CDS:2 [Funneliformis caledonium]|uniref:15338_t:CDS:1 n=1 Tax=Funneliformis caledonium TaxID=1117310 RepID=A0A9N9E1I7_9GLOM|nr:15338_t:CDS:2 [Funneliformis caledonium]
MNFSLTGIVAITKDIQKITLHPTVELFKGHLESYVEKHSKGYIKDIGKHCWNSPNADIKIIEWKRNPWVAKAYTSLWKVDDTGLPMINTIIMKAIPKEDKEVCLKPLIIAFILANCNDDLKDDNRSNDYNGTIEEEISEENHYESEDAMLFE